MKHIATICVILCASVTTLWAQPQQERSHRGDFQKFQVQLLVKQLEIEQSKQDEFEAIYTEYSTKIKALHPKRKAEGEGKGKERLTDEIVEQQILDSFEIAEKNTALKKEYYPRFKTIMSPHQILKMYKDRKSVV